MVKLQRRWKKGAVAARGLDAEKCERELSRIQKQGMLTPESVIEAARDVESPLHAGFTWDDTEAAKKWRLEEAASIIRAVVYVEDTEQGEREIRCFVNVKNPDEEIDATTKGYYVPVRAALTDDRYRRQILETALRDAESFADKYRDLQELARIVRAIDTTVREYERAHAAPVA